MKLYTELQVREAISKADVHYNIHPNDIENAINLLTPIELPSDEEIKEYSDRYSTIHEDVSDKLGKYLVSASHIDGANWMKEQILNQNK